MEDTSRERVIDGLQVSGQSFAGRDFGQKIEMRLPLTVLRSKGMTASHLSVRDHAYACRGRFPPPRTIHNQCCVRYLRLTASLATVFPVNRGRLQRYFGEIYGSTIATIYLEVRMLTCSTHYRYIHLRQSSEHDTSPIGNVTRGGLNNEICSRIYANSGLNEFATLVSSRDGSSSAFRVFL